MRFTFVAVLCLATGWLVGVTVGYHAAVTRDHLVWVEIGVATDEETADILLPRAVTCAAAMGGGVIHWGMKEATIKPKAREGNL